MMLAIGSNCNNNTFNVLLKQLQQIWAEIGETESDKNRMLLELERDCLEIYQKKVDEAANAKAHLHQSIVAKEAELAMLMASLGETHINSHVQSSKNKSLKGQLAAVTPLVDDFKIKKEERVKQFAEIKSQIEKINGEISGYGQIVSSLSSLNVDDQDLSVRKLMEHQSTLRALQKDKSERIRKVMDYVNELHSLSSVLNLDFGKTVSEVHPSLQGSGSALEHVTNISDSILEGLDQALLRLKTERTSRFQKLKDVTGSLFELWNLMDSPKEETIKLLRITKIVELSESAIMESGALSLEIIEQVSAEVERLTKLKANRLKELVVKKRSELENICSKIHIQPDQSTAAEKTNALIDSGLMDPGEILANIEAQISKAKEEALSRKEIMDRIDRWLSACDEENWLEDYNLDQNRYSAGRGAHINLKRAERARITVNKIPVMVHNLISKTLAWEKENQKYFLYDGGRLVVILEDYKQARQHKKEERKQAKDRKKLQDMLVAEKEAIYGSKPSPRRSSSLRMTPNRATGSGSVTPSPRRRSSIGTSELLTPRSYSGRHNGYFKEMTRLSTGPLKFVSTPKEDIISFSSVCGSEPESPPQP